MNLLIVNNNRMVTINEPPFNITPPILELPRLPSVKRGTVAETGKELIIADKKFLLNDR